MALPATARWIACALFGCLLAIRVSAAELNTDEGQELLDEAITAKLTASTMQEIGEVIDLCQEAIDAGLDKEQEAFAKRLLSSTLVNRATAIHRAVGTIQVNDEASRDRYIQLMQAAVSDVSRATQHDPNLYDAHMLLGQLMLMPGGNKLRAFQSLDSAVKAAGEDKSLKSQALLARAPLQPNPEKMLEDYDQATELAPTVPGPYRSRGLLKLQMKKLDAAIADFEKALELEEEHSATHEAMSLALFHAEKLKESLKHLDRAVELSPKSLSARLRRAELHSRMENHEAAIADLNELLELSPNKALVLINRAQYEQMDKLDKALEDLDAAIKEQPDLNGALLAKAGLLHKMTKTDEAIDLLKQSAAGGNTDPNLLLRLSGLYHTQKKFKQALEVLTDLVTAVPNAPQAYRARADIYLATGKYAEAIADYQKAVELDAEDSGTLNNLAWLLCTATDDNIRDGKRAVELAEKACELSDHGRADLLSTLAAAYAETGDFKTAVKWSSKALELAPEDLKDRYTKELNSFKAEKPWREEPDSEE